MPREAGVQVAPEQQEPRELRLESRHGSPPAMQEEDRASASEDAEIPTQRRQSSLRPIPLSHRAEVSETESGERILHPHREFNRVFSSKSHQDQGKSDKVCCSQGYLDGNLKKI